MHGIASLDGRGLDVVMMMRIDTWDSKSYSSFLLRTCEKCAIASRLAFAAHAVTKYAHQYDQVQWIIRSLRDSPAPPGPGAVTHWFPIHRYCVLPAPSGTGITCECAIYTGRGHRMTRAKVA